MVSSSALLTNPCPRNAMRFDGYGRFAGGTHSAFAQISAAQMMENRHFESSQGLGACLLRRNFLRCSAEKDEETLLRSEREYKSLEAGAIAYIRKKWQLSGPA